jgi:hypothetical protein
MKGYYLGKGDGGMLVNFFAWASLEPDPISTGKNLAW